MNCLITIRFPEKIHHGGSRHYSNDVGFKITFADVKNSPWNRLLPGRRSNQSKNWQLPFSSNFLKVCHSVTKARFRFLPSLCKYSIRELYISACCHRLGWGFLLSALQPFLDNLCPHLTWERRICLLFENISGRWSLVGCCQRLSVWYFYNE